LTRLKHIIAQALAQTATLWEPIAIAFGWVHQVATILDNDAKLDAHYVRHALEQLLQSMEHCRGEAGSLATGIDHFLKVTRSYAPGLFHCYDIANLPKTNNDLEQLFGKWRHHQRRCTGRKAAPPSLVVRGSVQIVAAIATQLCAFTAHDLANVSIEAWKSTRSDLNRYHLKRIQQRQFRRSPATYLANLEQKFLQSALPL
jgi:hypothetical protein